MTGFFENARKISSTPLMIGGHRGHLSSVRENTIPNFKEVAGSGISHIEVDIQLTKDGQPVVFHDISLSPATKLTGFVSDYTLAELKDSFEINTLDEVLDWCSRENLPAALEIKSYLPAMAETMPLLAQKIAELLTSHNFFDMSFVFSTNWQVLAEIKHLAPKTCLGLIVPIVPPDPAQLMRDMQAEIYLCYLDNLTKEIVDNLHSQGFIVDGSVVNDEETLRKAIELNVDFIESDHPKKMIEIYRRLTQL